MRERLDTLPARVRAFLQARGLLRPDATVLVAVSGGPDSLALLHALDALRDRGGPALHVAHLDHGARGAQSAAEAEAVAVLAAAWGLPATVARRDVPALAREGREGLLAAARRARYAFLAEVALATGAAAVAVAHQLDDQAETVLLHATRGAGLAGLRGMRDVVPWGEWGGGDAGRGGRGEGGTPDGQDGCPRVPVLQQLPPLIRPLLTTSRAEVEGYCREHGLRPFEDPSNSSPRFARARARRLLRELAAENPRVAAALGRTARAAAADHDFIQGQLDAAWPALAAEAPGGVLLRRRAWEALHPALRRHALRRAAAALGQAELSLAQLEAALELAGRPGRRMRLGPRLWLAVEQDALSLARAEDEAARLSGLASALAGAGPGADAAGEPPAVVEPGERASAAGGVSGWAPPGGAAAPQLAVDELPLPARGAVAVGGGWACEVRGEAPDEPSPWWAALDPASLDGPLALRRRRPGDRFRPAGGRGSRTLQDFFVDRRVPRALRDAWPILATPAAVVWVAGLRADERFAAGAQSQGTIWVGLVRVQDG